MPPGDGKDAGYKRLASAVILQAAQDMRVTYAKSGAYAVRSVKRWLLHQGCDWAEIMGVDREAFERWVKDGRPSKNKGKGNQYINRVSGGSIAGADAG